MDTAQDSRPKPKRRTIAMGIVIVLIVTLSVVAVVLLNEANGRGHIRNGLPLTVTHIPGGVKITLASMSKETPWTDVTILLTDPNGTAAWSPPTTDLDNGTTAKWNKIALAANLGTLKVNISITDLVGNGFIDQGDYFNLTVGTGQTFSSATTYTMTMMHDPTSSVIFHLDFHG